MTVEERIAQLEALLIELAPGLDHYFNPNKATEGRKIGFLLCAFDFGEKGAMSYVSNAQVGDLAAAMRELIGKLDETARIVEARKG